MAGLQDASRASGSALARITWGATPPLPSALAQAALEGDLAGKVYALDSDPGDGLAAALARLGRSVLGRNP